MCSFTKENNEAQAQLCSVTQRNTHERGVAHLCRQEKLHNLGLIRYWIIQTLKLHFRSCSQSHLFPPLQDQHSRDIGAKHGYLCLS